MKTKSLLSKVLAAALAVVMLVGLAPNVALAAEASGTPASGSLDDLVMNKTAKLEDDGTYTITLEAYAKGEVTTQVVKQVVPTDVILILDQSGSMDDSITGIPGDTYSQANPTNQQVVDSQYYYKVGDKYYRVTATKEIITKSTQWVGDDGNVYTEDQLSYSWQRKHDGQTYNTGRPFVASSLSTWTRSHTSILSRFYYVNDVTGVKSPEAATAKGARRHFQNKYKGAYNTVEFHNDGNPGTSTDADDPYYVAAVYIAVNKKEVNTCRYTYTYVDDSGKTVVIGQSAEANESQLDAAPCAINPLYTRDTRTGTRLEALQYAANKFIDDIRINAIANGVDHRVAVIGFASSGTDYNDARYENTELFVGATQYRYNGTGNNAPSAHYTEAFQSAGTAAGYANLQTSVDNLDAYGGTYPQYGFEMGNGVFANNSASYTKQDGTEGTRSRIVIFMTDGEPGSGGSVNTTEATATINKAGISKNTYGAKVYSVAVQNAVGTDQANFLSSVSSEGTYTLATSAEELEGFFSEVSSEITSSTTDVTLTKDAFLVDTVSEYFVLPEDFSIANNVKVMTAQHVGDEVFLSPAGTTKYQAQLAQNGDGDVTGITVTGFDYVENKVTTSVSNGGSTDATGSKLVVEITGLLAKDTAAVGTYINTNSKNSGIWDKDEDGNYGMIKAFPMPTTLLDRKTFVLDYAKDAQLDLHASSKVDSASDLLFSKVDSDSTSLSGSFGNVNISDGALVYTPKTTCWNGYDTFYALGKDTEKGDPVTKNIWSKVSVLPANNVYYEDTFVTESETGTVGIVFSDGWDKVKAEEGSGSNGEDVNGPIQGWVKDLADDTGDSDGTVTMSSTKQATATFTFTGTGFDVYSRTNMTSGKVYAKISWTDGEGNHNQGLFVDTVSESGEYYSIPTLWFSGEYNKYTVKLTVQNDAPKGKYSYCIDGIRIYNPLNPDVVDETVVDAYGDERNASFESVRDILLQKDSLSGSNEVNGVVFIDKIADGDKGTTNEIGVYEEYGPKNEVYLAPGNAIAFYVGTDVEKLHVGLKAPEGGMATAKVSASGFTEGITVAHTTDLYYEVKPDANGFVVIENASPAGGALLSVTKVKFFAGGGVAETTADELIAAVDRFDAMTVLPYTSKLTPGITDSDIVIENPGPAYGNPAIENSATELLRKLFSDFRGWFHP